MQTYNTFSPHFELTEEQGTRLLPELFANASSFDIVGKKIDFELEQTANESKLGFVELGYSKDPSEQAGIVGELIAAIHYCSTKGIPLLLNRSGDNFDKKEVTGGFKLGIQSSGTTGKPKWVLHDFERLLRPLKDISTSYNGDFVSADKDLEHRWLLTYHPFSFAGIQVILQCLVSGNALFSFPHLQVGALAKRAKIHKINALSCTPSMFRALNLAWQAKERPQLSTITLGGEIATQSILDEAKKWFGQAAVRHIYASTEAGVLFSVKDGLEGFPQAWLKKSFKGWLLSIEDEQLVLTLQYETSKQSTECPSSTFTKIDTGDRVKIENGRCFFIGRFDNIINVGGAKVDALAIENQIIGLDSVVDARVYAKPNPIVSNVIAVEIVSKDKTRSQAALSEWKKTVLSAQQPRLVSWVEDIRLSGAGKKQRIEL
jgi:acyl-coenzyme A synthetase/AMP-(fatty) acid ligase